LASEKRKIKDALKAALVPNNGAIVPNNYLFVLFTSSPPFCLFISLGSKTFPVESIEIANMSTWLHIGNSNIANRQAIFIGGHATRSVIKATTLTQFKVQVKIWLFVFRSSNQNLIKITYNKVKKFVVLYHYSR